MKHYVGEEGTDLIVDVGSDISGATTAALKVKKPDGTQVTWTGTVDGADNDRIKYTLTSVDFNLAGIYKVQAFVINSGIEVLGEIFDIKIHSPVTSL